MARVTKKDQQQGPKRAAIYPRVSTKGQEEDGTSLGTQEQQCREYALRQGYVVDESHVYREVHTGTELWERPQLTKLREAIRARAIDVVVVYAIDRLSRDPVHLGVILSEADHAGVEVFFVSEPLDDSPEGQLIRFVRGYAAKVEHEKIKERSIRGRRARVEAGKLLHGPRPRYGYTWNADKTAYVPHPAHSALVQRMFADAAHGKTLRAIAAQLDAEGILTPSGGHFWQHATVRCILVDPLYAGHAVGWRPNGEPGRAGIPLPDGTVPALVDQATFDAVQVRMDRNKAAAARNNPNPTATLLRGGYARCGLCGWSMMARRRPDRGTYVYWCGQNGHRGGCRHNIAAPLLDNAVWARVASVLTQPETIAAELERMRQNDPSTADLESVESSLTAVVRQQRNLVENLAQVNGTVASIIAEKLNALEAQRNQLTEERATILGRTHAWQQAQERLGDIQAWCHTVAANLETLSYEEKRLALDALGVHVTVWRTGHTPRYEIRANIPLDGAIVDSSNRSPCPDPA
ncbi:MAG TPA: recombinase family protein [Chloroflexota bacterium]|nr:recombinase family protein [Chloroflexota bacterium]